MFNMLVVIFSYNRPDMLDEVLLSIPESYSRNLDIVVIDDGSEYLSHHLSEGVVSVTRIKETGYEFELHSFPHGGKEKFWERYKYGIDYALSTGHENFVFMPDDFLDLDLHKIESIHSAWEDSTYSVNIINDGRNECWGRHKEGHEPVEFFDTKLVEVGFNDCGFITNRKTLSLIKIEPVTPDWFDYPEKSSGVGYQLTNQLRENNVSMFKPLKSMAEHGEHESRMHPEHRKGLTLKSI